MRGMGSLVLLSVLRRPSPACEYREPWTCVRYRHEIQNTSVAWTGLVWLWFIFQPRPLGAQTHVNISTCAMGRISGLLLFSFLHTISGIIVTNPYDYCIQYYGSITAEIELLETVSRFNNNDSISCPREWDFGRTQGAYLELCPTPYHPDRKKGSVIEVDLNFSPDPAKVSHPVSFRLWGGHSLITNGTYDGSVESNGEPAVLAADPDTWLSDRWQSNSQWTINGTGKAFTQTPSSTVSASSALLSCLDLDNPDQYCGEGCWQAQRFVFTMGKTLNYTVKFSIGQAEVELVVEDEFNNTGGNSVARFTFGGSRALLTAPPHPSHTQFLLSCFFSRLNTALGFARAKEMEDMVVPPRPHLSTHPTTPSPPAHPSTKQKVKRKAKRLSDGESNPGLRARLSVQFAVAGATRRSGRENVRRRR
ncbi:hypothetical protein M011DRAFT_498660 [Sporormia fimetaria CBS 119925]|uniref:Uncharacterized protein n=1 Tax=Sporormia fimetaria CBS 119925 TaxID=1340428 RepID=A0A6A6VS87_9PLEO|nr:hypothetical protein M011DRAFT_498660 [Sporormia fimetaria CBS 119925]